MNTLPKAPDEKEMKAWFVRLQSFMANLNSDVNKDQLKTHPYARGVKYLPISFIEMNLDKLFFGLWKTDNFRWEQIQNEIVGSIDVHVFHPLERVWITRSGAMAIQIMVDKVPDDLKGSEKNLYSIDPANKKPNALSMGGFSALKADCFKNACLSIGKSFGRDINRDDTAEYHAWIKGDGGKSEIDALKKKLSSLLELVQDVDLKQGVIDRITTAESNGSNTVDFYQGEIDYLMNV